MTAEAVFLLVATCWLAMVVLTGIAARARGRSVVAWVLAAIPFGLFALLAVLVAGPNRKAAPVAPVTYSEIVHRDS